jgi:uncharacterized membrane protein YkvA (DUF1232 family)
MEGMSATTEEGSGRDLVPVDPERLKRDEAKVERGFWPKVRRTLGRVPFVEEAVAAYYCALDPQTPLQVKAILLGALAYFVVPTDMIPDFIAWLGYTDDAAVLAAAIRSVGGAIKDTHREKARSTLDHRPTNEAGA